MRNIKLNDLLSEGIFYPELTVGLTRDEIEKVLGRTLGSAYIETEDVDHYIIDAHPGVSFC